MRRSLPALPLVAALALLAPLLLSADPSADPSVDASRATEAEVRLVADEDTASTPVRRRAPGSDPHTWQTSDRVIGPSAPPAAGSGAERRGPGTKAWRKRTVLFDYKVAPGIWATSVQERNQRGTYRYSYVIAKWRRPSVDIGLMRPAVVAATQKTAVMTRRTRNGVVGINGDFFDIGDTGAPLGVGVNGSRLRHGRTHGWNAAFYLDGSGRPRIGTLPVAATIAERPDIAVTNVNSAQVMPNGIGVYTPAWGRTSGYRWTDGQQRHVRMLLVKDGRVVRKTTAFRAGQTFEGQILVARGRPQAALLDSVEVGDDLTVRWGAEGRPRTAITGNQVVLEAGRILATDDVELHPRTAIGIDPRRKRLILLVVDGRQSFSDGYTMVQVAKKLRGLGAQAGLNLDGGGSSTLIGHRHGRLRELNSPSDGRQRKVANGLVVTSRIPPRS